MPGEPACDALTVRPLTAHDAAWSASLHKRTLSVGLFPALGQRFLRRYHRSFVDSTTGVAIIACSNGRPAGFVLGVLDPEAHRLETVRRHGLGLGVVGVSAILLRPALLIRFGRTRLRSYLRVLWRQLRPRQRSGTAGLHAHAAVLSHIAVEDSARGLGIGAMLVDAVTEAARDAGTRTVQTSTVDRASFYESLGWTVSGAGRTFDGATEHRLTRSVSVDGAR
ncbi:MAG: GNAT family N-acetyltransferase [Acidimicrobiales bacterium]|nr:GNAT family N-acetyltransferase [Acidimicrobiales bacterium]